MHQKPIDVAGSLFTVLVAGEASVIGSHGSRTAVGAQKTTMPTDGFFVSELEYFAIFYKLWFLSRPAVCIWFWFWFPVPRDLGLTSLLTPVSASTDKSHIYFDFLLTSITPCTLYAPNGAATDNRTQPHAARTGKA